MANDVTINPGTGGAKVSTTDISAFTAYSNQGEVPSGALYVSQGTALAPGPALPSNPVPTAAAVVGDALWLGGVAYPVLRAFANATASGDTTVVAAVTSKKIRVLWVIVGPVSAAVNVFFKSSVAGAIGSTKYLAANGGYGRTTNVYGHFETVAGEALAINLSGTANAGVDVGYILV